MSYNGNGVYALPAPQYPAIPGTTIFAEDFNTIVSDIASALSTALVRDGQAAMFGPLNMGGQAITNVATIAAQLAGLVITGQINFTAATVQLGAATGITKPSNTNTTDLATCAFVMQTAINAAVPVMTGHADEFLTNDGTNALWDALPASVVLNSHKQLGGM